MTPKNSGYLNSLKKEPIKPKHYEDSMHLLKLMYVMARSFRKLFVSDKRGSCKICEHRGLHNWKFVKATATKQVSACTTCPRQLTEYANGGVKVK